MREEKKIKPAKALGFWVEDVGGGFEYIIFRQGVKSVPRTAEVDDMWDVEFDDIQIRGSERHVYSINGSRRKVYFTWADCKRGLLNFNKCAGH